MGPDSGHIRRRRTAFIERAVSILNSAVSAGSIFRITITIPPSSWRQIIAILEIVIGLPNILYPIDTRATVIQALW